MKYVSTASVKHGFFITKNQGVSSTLLRINLVSYIFQCYNEQHEPREHDQKVHLATTKNVIFDLLIATYITQQTFQNQW